MTKKLKSFAIQRYLVALNKLVKAYKGYSIRTLKLAAQLALLCKKFTIH